MDRRIKKHIHGVPHRLLLLSPPGCADIVREDALAILDTASEKDKFGADLVDTRRGIEIRGLSYRLMTEIVLRQKTARDAVWLLHQARAGSLGEVVSVLAKAPWELLIESPVFHVRADSRGSRVYNEGDITQVVSRHLTGLGWKAGEKDEATAWIDVALDQNQLTIGISLAGRPLYHRGYKTNLRSRASIREDLAACCIRWAAARIRVWTPEFTPVEIMVPFAGSGTLGFESAIHWDNLPLSRFRLFAFQAFLCRTEATERSILSRLESKASRPLRVTLIDLDPEQVEACRENVKTFCLRAGEPESLDVSVEKGDFFENSPNGAAFVPLNPPYGLRIGGKDSPSFYRRIADHLRAFPCPLGGFVISPTPAASRAFSDELRDFQLSSRPLKHGGRTVELIAFFRAAP